MIARFTTSDEAFLREARITCEPMPQPKPQIPEEELLEPSEAVAIFAGMYRKEHARAENLSGWLLVFQGSTMFLIVTLAVVLWAKS